MPPAQLSGDRPAHLRAALPYGNKLHALAHALGEKVWVCSWMSNPFVPQPPAGALSAQITEQERGPEPLLRAGGCGL